MSAPTLDPRDPVNAIDGMAETARRLICDFGARILWESLPDDHGIWDGDARTVTINVDSCIADQCCFLTECWRLCAIGPEAAPDMALDEGPGGPHLRLVGD
ncbi:hypothetical protein EV383_4497 [Pseudonocardia sediminis]|uniref:Uncharacterized protein n=1 Tax=Pseudonocardia sediminis TaxID=1397368 RepID=A0A4Q7UZK2_PSEST|nr:hypothetical protein [Pseudonocardia sediminis]RZT87572.1 hypothetical protein EV383_4497 [Pseudonocardia sediminis]